MKLIITEKPSQARTVRDALLDDPTEDTYYDHPYWYDDEITIVPLVGHIYDLDNVEPWGDYPSFPETEHVPVDGKKSIHNLVNRELDKADEVIVGTDVDREGSLIGGLAVLVPENGPDSLDEVSRMRYSAVTEDEIREAWEDRGPFDMDRYEAGLARKLVDYYVGINLSKALSQALLQALGDYKTLSAGRVQSPLLKIITERVRERREFDPETYYVPKLQTDTGETFVGERTDEQAIGEPDTIEIGDVSTSTWRDFPPNPLNLPEAQKQFPGSASQVQNNLQNLYQDGYITYPRTENQVYPDGFDFDEPLAALRSYSPFDVPDFDTYDPTVGDKFDEAHPPITPTANVPHLNSLDKWEKKTYIRVAKHFIATLMDPAIKQKTVYTATVDGMEFTYDVRTMQNMGYLSVYGPYRTVYDDDPADWDEGNRLSVNRFWFEEKETEPPNRYTKSSVIGEMEDVGIGTSATRANIVDKIHGRDYVVSDGGIEVTPIGEKIVDALDTYAPELTNPEFTSELESLLDDVEQGTRTREDVLETMKDRVRAVCEDIREHEESIGEELRSAYVLDGACEECGGDLILRESNGDLFYGCSNYDPDDGCYNTVDISEMP